MKVFSVLFIIAFSLAPNVFSQPFTSHTITDSADGGMSVYAVDFEGDGDIDVLSASAIDDKIAWYENDGNENFTSHTIATSADRAAKVYAEDVDGDGDIDVLSASYDDDKIAWYENDGNENFTSHTIVTDADGALSVHAVDVDGDGDIDVLSASWYDHKIAWYENDGSENFTIHIITTNASNAGEVYAIDVDGDGDMDVLSASYNDDKIAWYENDGSEYFTSHTITTDADGARSVYAEDVDGDGDVDVLSASWDDDKIAWYENDGNENFTPHTISTSAISATAVYAIDVDGDGDIDVLSASALDDKIAWYENDGNENFTSHTITTDTENARSVYAEDVDGDGDMDVLSASYWDKKIAWYENLFFEIVLIAPNGGELYEPGETLQIQWSSQNIQNVKIDISTDNGTTWSNITPSTAAGSGQFDWLISQQVNSDSCLIRICDVPSQSICDVSDNVFIIQESSSLTVISPNGGEVWPWGSTQDITWSSINVTDVKIELSLNNGAIWTKIIESTLSNGNYSWLVNPLQPSTQALIRISDVSDETTVDHSDDVFTIDIAPGVEDEFSGIPDSYKLSQNYPNPFNPVTKIYYGVPQTSYVELAIYDLLGNEIVMLISDEKEAGYHSVNFDASIYNSGIYFYSLKAGNFVETKKMILLK